MARNYNMRKRVMVTGGAGFLGSHLADRLLEAGHEVLCVDNLFTGTKDNIAHLHSEPELRVHAARRHLPALRGGGRDLQSRLPGLADPLPARSRCRRPRPRCTARSTCWAWPSGSAARSSRPRPARSTATRRSIRRPRTIGATSTRSARAPATTRASAAPRPCSSTITGSTGCRSRSRGSSTPMARACIRPTAAWCPTSSCRRCSGEPITIYGDGSQTRSFCYVDDLIDGLMALMETGPDDHRPDQPRQSQRIHGSRARREGDRADRLKLAEIIEEPLPQDDPKQRQPDISKAKRDLGWEPTIQLEQGLVKTIDYFRSFV